MAGNPKSFRLNNLFGGINNVAEINALASFDTQGQGIGAEAQDIENFVPLNRGGQSTAGGFYTFFDTTVASAVTGLYQYIKSTGSKFFLYSQGTKVYKLVSSVATDIGATISNGAYPSFETALDLCVICDGVSAPVSWDGTTIAALGGTPPTGPIQSLFYQNRLWLVKGSFLYYSNPSDINAGYSTQFVQCDVNDGQKIVGISKYFVQGSLIPIILVQKERSIGIVTGLGTTASPYAYSRINQDVGGVSFRSLVQFGTDLAYLTPRGVSSVKTDSSIFNLLYEYLSENVRPKFQALSTSAANASIAWYDWKKNRISFAVAEGGFTTPNVIWHYDIRLKCWYKERWASGQDCTSSIIDTTGVWYHGDSSGKIYLHDGSGSFAGKAINSYYTTGYMDFGDPTAFKHLRQCRMMVRSNGSYPIGISSSLNYGTRTGSTTNLQISAGSYLWGQGTWNNDNSYMWGASPVNFPKFFPGGDFQNIAFTITKSGVNQPVDIFELEFITQYTGLL